VGSNPTSSAKSTIRRLTAVQPWLPFFSLSSLALTALAGIDFPYRDIGKCIYCGSTEPPLTREHVVPKGLGGRLSPDGHHEAIVLRNASCTACQRITQSFESDCLLKNFGLLRHRKKLREKGRNTAQYAQMIDLGDGVKQKVQFDIEDLYSFIMMPLLEPAGYLTGRWQNSLFDAEMRPIVTHSPRRGREPIAPGSTVHYDVDLPALYRVLAKIAHGMAVARYGANGFEPKLLGIILGTFKMFGMWIGSSEDERNAPPQSNCLCQIRLAETPIYQNKTAIVAWIRLFAEYPTPVYHVLAGVIDIPFEERKQLVKSGL
jgi:hypothetical protein